MHSRGPQVSAEPGTGCTCPHCRKHSLTAVIVMALSLRAGRLRGIFCRPLPQHCVHNSRSKRVYLLLAAAVDFVAAAAAVSTHRMVCCQGLPIIAGIAQHACLCACRQSGACQLSILSTTHVCCMLWCCFAKVCGRSAAWVQHLFAPPRVLYIWIHFFNCACALFYASCYLVFVACMHANGDAPPCICWPVVMLHCGVVLMLLLQHLHCLPATKFQANAGHPAVRCCNLMIIRVSCVAHAFLQPNANMVMLCSQSQRMPCINACS